MRREKMKDFLLILILGWSAIFFFSVVSIAPPLLVGYIIAQVETPFVLRIGLVSIIYAILFATVFFLVKNFDYPDEPSRISWGSILFALLLSLIVIFAGFETWEELQLRHQLLQEGVSGVATVQECSATKYARGGGSCHLEYEYEVPQANNTTKWYRVREKIPCPRECRIGYSVDIAYLPQAPSKAGIEGNTYDLRVSVFALANCFNILFILLVKLLWDLRSWLRK